MTEKTRARRVIVHLGNVGEGGEGESEADKTRAYASRFPQNEFIGIDLKELKETPSHGNWRQIRLDFNKGLELLDDGSVDLISSDVAFGYFTGDYSDTWPSRRYWRALRDSSSRTFAVAYEKLKAGGKFLFVVDNTLAGFMEEVLGESPFSDGKIEVRELTEREYERTYWTRKQHGEGVRLFQVTAEK